MRNQYQDSEIKYYIGNVRDKRLVDSVMIGVDYIFSPPAINQVSYCEYFPIQAVSAS